MARASARFVLFLLVLAPFGQAFRTDTRKELEAKAKRMKATKDALKAAAIAKAALTPALAAGTALAEEARTGGVTAEPLADAKEAPPAPDSEAPSGPTELEEEAAPAELEVAVEPEAAKAVATAATAPAEEATKSAAQATVAAEATGPEAAGVGPEALVETAAMAGTAPAHSTEATPVEQASGPEAVEAAPEAVEAAPAALAETAEVAETAPANSSTEEVAASAPPNGKGWCWKERSDGSPVNYELLATIPSAAGDCWQRCEKYADCTAYSKSNTKGFCDLLGGGPYTPSNDDEGVECYIVRKARAWNPRGCRDKYTFSGGKQQDQQFVGTYVYDGMESATGQPTYIKEAIGAWMPDTKPATRAKSKEVDAKLFYVGFVGSLEIDGWVVGREGDSPGFAQYRGDWRGGCPDTGEWRGPSFEDVELTIEHATAFTYLGNKLRLTRKQTIFEKNSSFVGLK